MGAAFPNVTAPAPVPPLEVIEMPISSDGLSAGKLKAAQSETPATFTPTVDIKATLEDGREIQVAKADVPIAYTDALAIGVVPLDPVKNAHSDDIQSFQFTALWDEMPNAATYVIDVATDAEFENFATGWQQADTSGETSITVDSLTPETTYHWRVRASVYGNLGPYSNVVEVATVAD